MTLEAARRFFESLKIETANKSEITIYNRFIHILDELEIREFSKDEIQSIEKELESLNLRSNPGNRKKYFSKALSKFEKHLKDQFSLTSKGYYSSVGLGLGCSFGILFGVIALSSFERSLGIAMGLIFGMLLGLIIGRSFDTKAKSENRVI